MPHRDQHHADLEGMAANSIFGSCGDQYTPATTLCVPRDLPACPGTSPSKPPKLEELARGAPIRSAISSFLMQICPFVAGVAILWGTVLCRRRGPECRPLRRGGCTGRAPAGCLRQGCAGKHSPDENGDSLPHERFKRMSAAASASSQRGAMAH
jgi:hypothetical protein